MHRGLLTVTFSMNYFQRAAANFKEWNGTLGEHRTAMQVLTVLSDLHKVYTVRYNSISHWYHN